MNEKKKYWYKVRIYLCPLCGREDVYRERCYDEKPKDPSDRIQIKEVWDYCGAL